MENNYYQLYLESTFKLCESLVIKSTAIAQLWNESISNNYGSVSVNETDPASWKYYLNMAGEYHPLDQQMTVTSVDTRQQIVFSKQSLADSPSTAYEYRYGTQQYQELLARYPDQKFLIRGIINPVDINTALAAPDYTILAWSGEDVEAHETSLIANLQEFINQFMQRWNIQGYNITDDLFAPALMGVLYSTLIEALMVIRKRACKTPEAHSFHIRQYLGSHSQLDEFYQYMTLNQALYLYRNIMRIEKNAGQNETLSELIEHIMTERNFPIASYSMEQDTALMPEQLTPELTFKKTPVNDFANVDGLQYYTLDAILNKQEELTPGNASYRSVQEVQVPAEMKYSPSDVVQTKIFESSVIDYTDIEPYILSETLLNHWLAFSHEDRYVAYVSFTNPSTTERNYLPADEAFALMFYCYAKTLGITLEQWPEVKAVNVVSTPQPSIDQLLQVVGPSRRILASEVSQIRNWLPQVPTRINSVQVFYNLGQELNAAHNKQAFYTFQKTAFWSRGYAKLMVSRMWKSGIYQIGDPAITPTRWLSLRNIDLSNFTIEDYQGLYAELIERGTGSYMYSNVSLSSIHKAMSSMFTRLNSYSIQLLQEINDGSYRFGPTGSLGYDNVEHEGDGQMYVPIVGPDLNNIQQTSIYSGYAPIPDVKFTPYYEIEDTTRYDIGFGVNFMLNPESSFGQMGEVIAPMVKLSYPMPVVPPNPEGYYPVLGIEEFINSTTQAQRESIPDIWGSRG